MTRYLLLIIIGITHAMTTAMSQAVPVVPKINTPTEITVSGDLTSGDTTSGLIKVVGNVKISAEQLSITADEASYNIYNHWIEAAGNVTLIDPAGEIHTDYILYNVETGAGSTKNLLARTMDARFSADNMVIERTKWISRGVRATTCDCEKPPYEFTASKVIIRPNRAIIAQDVRVFLYGRQVFWLPITYISMKTRERAFPAPSFGYVQGKGASLRMEQPIRITDPLWFYAITAIYAKDKPETQFVLGYSLLKKTYPFDIQVPETRDRFGTGFMDRLVVSSLSAEEKTLSEPASTLYFERSSNIPVYGRTIGDFIYGKDWEAGWRGNILMKPLFSSFALRAGKVRNGTGAATDRYSLEAVITSQEIALNSIFSIRPKISAAQFFYSDDKSFAWIRPQLELYLRPTENTAFGFAYLRSIRFNEPETKLDEIEIRHAVSGRMDLKINSVRLSSLVVYDLDKEKVHDVQIRFSSFSRCIEPVITWRMEPSEFRFSFNLTSLEAINEIFRKRKGEIEELTASKQSN